MSFQTHSHMDDKVAIEILKGLLGKHSLDDDERRAPLIAPDCLRVGYNEGI